MIFISKRDLLDLDPPYQRRSVWNQEYKDYFIDTILLDYPAPAIFLFEEIDPNGITEYKVVDGKQRLMTIFEFIEGNYPVYEKAEKSNLIGQYFSDFDLSTKKKFWAYDFLVEYLPSNDESIISTIFNRINKNVAKLTAQELRHARFDGEFIRISEDYADIFIRELPNGFPRIGNSSRNKMKDVELIADLLLLTERGPIGYNQLELDYEFSQRDLIWDKKEEVVENFKKTFSILKELINSTDGQSLVGSRFRNQNDFYSLFGALLNLSIMKQQPDYEILTSNLLRFAAIVEDEDERKKYQYAEKYWDNVRPHPIRPFLEKTALK